MHQLNQALQAGYAAFQRGDLVTARRKLSGFEHPKAVHLLALVEKAAGNQETAASLFARAVSDDPNGNVRARVLDAYRLFGEKVQEVMGKDVKLIETDHFLIWTDFEARDRERLALWCEAMYSAL
ncbi:MAG: hypothetical protein IID59_11375, partial [Proteobacteria bacterium]|nr:hypothetical protein [Pseudomonadota bacterium]